MGYTPVAAFLDIIDNSIAAKATEVEVISGNKRKKHTSQYK
jgi:hypothetical protein